MSRSQVFSTFLECSQMSGVFYHSVIYDLDLERAPGPIYIIKEIINATFRLFYSLAKYSVWD